MVAGLNQNSLDGVIDILYRGVLDKPITWMPFLRAFRTFMGTDSVTIAWVENGHLMYDISDRSWFMNSEEQYARREKIRMLGHYNPIMGVVSAVPGSIANTSEMSNEQRRNNPWYQDYFREMQLEYQILMVGGHTEKQFLLSCVNKKQTGLLKDGHTEVFRQLYPHLERAWEIYHRLTAAEKAKEAYESAFDSTGIASFLLNGFGKVVQKNRAASHMATDKNILSLQKGKLTFARPDHSNRCRQEVWKAIAERVHGGGKPYCKAFRIELEEGEDIAVIVRSLPITSGEDIPVEPQVAVYVLEPSKKQVPSVDLVSQLFDLRPSEARLAILLANGYSAAEAANELGISIGNARTTAVRMYPKAGAVRQGDLALRILNCASLLS